MRSEAVEKYLYVLLRSVTMSEQIENALLIPGVGVVGRGISVRPRQPYQLREIITKRNQSRPYYSKETGETYIEVPTPFDHDHRFQYE